MKTVQKNFLIVALVIAAIGVWSYLGMADQRQLLEAEGFIVTQEIPGSPPILIDANRQRLAAIYPDSFVTAEFSQVVAVEALLAHGEQAERQQKLVIKFNTQIEEPWLVNYQNSQQLQQAQAQLRKHLLE